jgi:hypothetical protein
MIPMKIYMTVETTAEVQIETLTDTWVARPRVGVWAQGLGVGMYASAASRRPKWF